MQYHKVISKQVKHRLHESARNIPVRDRGTAALLGCSSAFSLLFSRAEVPLGPFSAGPNVKSFMYIQEAPNTSPEKSNTQNQQEQAIQPALFSPLIY